MEVARPITEFRNCEIFHDPITSWRTPLRSPPIVLLALSHMFHSSSQSLLKRLSGRRTWSRGPCGPDHIRRPSKRLIYTHRSQAGRTSRRGPGVVTPDHPRPRIGVDVLRECHASPQAHLYAHVQHIVVDLEEPRSLGATIKWPAGWAMHQPAYQLRGILLGTSVNKGDEAGPELLRPGPASCFLLILPLGLAARTR
jgi:hypothetical protein